MKKGWESKKVSELAKTYSGGTPSKSKKEYYENGTIPWLQSGEVNQAEIFESRNYISELGLKNSSAKLFPKDTVLIAMYGATAAQCGLLRFPSTSNQAVCGILPNETVSSEYTYYFFLHHKAELLTQAVGNAQPNISQAKIKNTTIPIPPLSEQEEIVEVLDKAFAAIDQAKANIEQNIANAKELFQSKLNQIFSQKGEGWVETTLTEISKVQTGKHDANHASDTGKYRFYTCAYDHLRCDTKRFSGPSIILPGNGANVGEVFYYDGEFDAYQRTYVINSIEISPDYLFFHLKALWRERNLNKQYGSATNFLKIGNFKDYAVSYPTNANEQMHIVRICADLSDQLESIASHYQSKLDSLDELKKSILQKAFAGELT